MPRTQSTRRMTPAAVPPARWGPSDGGVYPVGGGFGQNYAGGKILFTPDTGAHLMAGAILQKYESLGGPADGDLGFPTIDEGPGRVSPESRNTTFSAADKPVIFWTPDTGAHVVRGAMNAAWDKLGGSAGPLGVPTEDEVFKGDVVSQKFTGGELSWNRSIEGVHHGAAGSGGAAGRVDRPRGRHLGDQRGQAGCRRGAGSARRQAGFAICDRPGRRRAGLRRRQDLLQPGHRRQRGQRAGPEEVRVGWRPGERPGLPDQQRGRRRPEDGQPGQHVLRKGRTGHLLDTRLRRVHRARGDERGVVQTRRGRGFLGPPVADQTEDDNVVTQRFTGGEISWDKQTNKFSTQPANLASGLSGLSVPGYEPPERTETAAAPDSNERNWFTPSWWWLLAGIPLLVLVGLVAVATLRSRGGATWIRWRLRPTSTPPMTPPPRPRRCGWKAPMTMARRGSPTVTVGHRNPRGSGWAGRTMIRSHRPAAMTATSSPNSNPNADDSDTAPTPIQSEADPNSGRHAAIELDEPPADLHEPAARARRRGDRTTMRPTPRPRFTCRSPTPTWPPPGTRSRRTPSQAGTGRRRAISTTTCPPRSTSSTRNSPAPTGSSRATSRGSVRSSE